MIFSKRCLHALRAVLYLGVQPPEREFVPIREISQKLDIPFHFLTKILKELADQGFIISSRGAAGGIQLAKPTSELNVKEIIESIEGEDYFSGCILGFSKCDNDNPCALHDRWVAIKAEIQMMLGEEHLESLADRIKTQGLRLLEI
ncbi:Rrf2 family transcriptional regulator [Kiritimatiellota bacterium B12222]|nr:Rrf2 family transcriptional regulator [Kiritimatiellota bacterium B12222]